MKIEMGKFYTNIRTGAFYDVTTISRNSTTHPVVLESIEGFVTVTACGRLDPDDDAASFKEYTPEPELINMHDRYESDGHAVTILTIDGKKKDFPVVAEILSEIGYHIVTYTNTGSHLSSGSSCCDLKKAESRPEMLIYKVKYNDSDTGCYSTGIIASPAASLYPWLGKMGTKHVSVEELDNLKYTGDETEPVVIG